MSLRLIVAALMIATASALGMIAYQLAVASRPHAPAVTQADAIPAPLQVSYFVAAHPLPAGTLVRDDDFRLRSALPSQVPANGVIDLPENRASLRGSLIRRYLEEGATITLSDLLRPRDRGFLATVLEPDTRAVAVGVDAVTGVAGLIWPGDRVDVILTQEMEHSVAPLARRVISETVLTNVRVIAVDQDIVRSTPATGTSGSHVARTVTLQVVADQAERLTIAQQLGHLSLAIRASDSTAQIAPDKSSLFSSDVSPALSTAGEPVGTRVHVIQGDKRSEVTFQ
jgi:pilus assembly protein CpaB